MGVRYNGCGCGWVEIGEGRPDVRFDVMSVDVGSSPSVPMGLVWEGGDGDPVLDPMHIVFL